jgi:hypothetical protein
MPLRQLYYLIKPLMPRRLQINLRRGHVAYLRRKHTTVWPINEKAVASPDGWRGWPDGKRFALAFTHDVDTDEGQRNVNSLVDVEMQMGFRSSFNFVPEGYRVSDALRHYLIKQGFEVGVHGLTHDGNLFCSEKYFIKQVPKINYYIKEWNAVGFRAPSMFHNLKLIHHLDIEYDASTFDVDPFEPQPDGVETVFPFWVEDGSSGKGYVELPYTLPQDFTVFVLMQEKSIDIWKRKLDWIVDSGGMALLNTHPDYMYFENNRRAMDNFPARYYEEFLQYIRTNYRDEYWHILPRDIAQFWKQNYQHVKCPYLI